MFEDHKCNPPPFILTQAEATEAHESNSKGFYLNGDRRRYKSQIHTRQHDLNISHETIHPLAI